MSGPQKINPFSDGGTPLQKERIRSPKVRNVISVSQMPVLRQGFTAHRTRKIISMIPNTGQRYATRRKTKGNPRQYWHKYSKENTCQQYGSAKGSSRYSASGREIPLRT
jgi:hypothetical protein